MSRSRWWIAAAAVVAIATLFPTPPTTGQPPAANPPGRYQLHVAGAAPNSTAFVIDTHTGRVWYRQTLPEVKGWTDLGSPADKK